MARHVNASKHDRVYYSKNRDKIISYNTARSNAVRARLRIENPELLRKYQRRSDLKKNFGISVDQYEAMCIQQGNVCAICKLPERRTLHGKATRLSVDHTHRNGVIRGLLCMRCNQSIERIDTLGEEWAFSAMAYIQHWKYNPSGLVAPRTRLGKWEKTNG